MARTSRNTNSETTETVETTEELSPELIEARESAEAANESNAKHAAEMNHTGIKEGKDTVRIKAGFNNGSMSIQKGGVYVLSKEDAEYYINKGWAEETKDALGHPVLDTDDAPLMRIKK